MKELNTETLQYYFKKSLDFINSFYPFIIGVIIFMYNFHIFVGNYSPGYKLITLIYPVIFLTAYKDVRKDVRWISFILLVIPLFLFVSYINKHGYAFWGSVLQWEAKMKIVFNLNPIFDGIPFNDASFARIYQSDNLTWFMRLVYNNGFTLCTMICIFRSAICKDIKKMLKYMCSAHVFQIFLISPFYVIFHLQEVWFVHGQPDMLLRHYSYKQAYGSTLNCFPSMHTSIAFAAFLLLLREKNKIFKTFWGFFCLSVIYSTMYLKIHWTIDVLGGLILAFCSVKLTDFVFAKLQPKLQPLIDKYYYRNSSKDISNSKSVSNLIQ
ncbi:phosphatase PAP2 family protein [Clostridium felsineum]|uniref:Uncharacterized protein n=1 Tax=Clostridium felsineum TaxID=36839 RepID=A0A1S8L272_9CLOT|nr:phosphatase PAP2 family protein [Clostridium felsineum]MCR3758807.1 phosphatase PAP2 family protein [Clostridium felsineum]URZ05362.1 hypothetical protein CLROS_006860 [Clostridium felsineum]URZ10403.1 hypothetical protein CROST_011110 [Clostridium felsineum]URZ17683.1 hypothetical protein CLFE_037380 [Clostridium felsineum DSM 794]